MADPEIARIAKEKGKTRASMSMEHAASLDKKLIFVVGNQFLHTLKSNTK